MKQFILALQLISNCMMAQDSLNNLSGMLGVPFGASKATVVNMMRMKYPNASIDSSEYNAYYITNVKWGNSESDNILFHFDTDGAFTDGGIYHEPMDKNDIFSEYRALVASFDSKYHLHDSNEERWIEPYNASDEVKYGLSALKMGKAKFSTKYFFNVNPSDPSKVGQKITLSLATSVGIIITYMDVEPAIKRLEAVQKNQASDY